MTSVYIFFFIATIYLTTLNSLQKKNKFCLDRVSSGEKHKILASFKKRIPLSGSFFFLPVFFYLLFPDNILLFSTCLLFFSLGLLSDIKKISSPKNRFLLQIIILTIYISFQESLVLDLRINFLDTIMESDFFRILILSFFLLVLINGFNFIDGVNNLCSLNFLIVLFFLYLLGNDLDNFLFLYEIKVLIIFLLVFVFLNFFGKNFLGDGGVYGISFLIGVLSIEISTLSEKISPYFIANLLWYPAFENLFSIVRRLVYKRKNYLADNFHLHQLILKFFIKYKIFKKKKYLLSSFTGICVNFYLIIIYIIGYQFYSKTNIQVMLISISIFIYILLYVFLLKKIR